MGAQNMEMGALIWRDNIFEMATEMCRVRWMDWMTRGWSDRWKHGWNKGN